jgi:hypothetical protein
MGNEMLEQIERIISELEDLADAFAESKDSDDIEVADHFEVILNELGDLKDHMTGREG